MKTVIKEILNWTWCLPQTLLGLAVKIFSRGFMIYETYGEGDEVKEIPVYFTELKSGSVSLGKYILIDKGSWNDLETIKHEYGHQIQSYILGPLYLLVIGLPSILWANIFWNPKKHNYSWFYTEAWANKLGKSNI